MVSLMIEAVVPVNEEFNQPLVLGVLLCFRQILPHLNNLQCQVNDYQGHSSSGTKKDTGYKLTLDHLVQVCSL